ncbi:uncharacterized protein SPSK_10134 [Sporothrix schenckii 1099-18]|uniref:Uncharacterized protein n=1 Tax=Sporothrix schenckii 1099-18 TaxID=1397361 RepID=A0A0F2MCN8_SPOSC|nr:uncharacterized protein SPSK_10134 [Sporothrix schenckii 1099-18]KJR85926.1 hypothetical protein SPSK_10134 [Sporothrix schenckii 1099-18]
MSIQIEMYAVLLRRSTYTATFVWDRPCSVPIEEKYVYFLHRNRRQVDVQTDISNKWPDRGLGHAQEAHAADEQGSTGGSRDERTREKDEKSEKT